MQQQILVHLKKRKKQNTKTYWPKLEDESQFSSQTFNQKHLKQDMYFEKRKFSALFLEDS